MEYFNINTEFFEDSRISFDAKGLLGYLRASNPKGGESTLESVVNKSTDDERTVIKILRELEKHGYIELINKNDIDKFRLV